jgi:hypothetical protein
MIAAGAASLAAGWGVGELLIPTASSAEPAKIVAMRFPAEWTDTYSPPPADVAENPEAPPQWLALVAPRPASPITPVAYFAETPQSKPIEVTGPVVASSEPEPAAESAPQARVQMASAGPVTIPRAKPPVVAAKVDPRRGAVFNDKQIASIKQRLALTPDQEQYWPTIEAALREVSWKKDAKKGTHTGHQMAQVDTSRVDMERLKSIAVPLVMSFREDQKRELRSLAHLMGLTDVASAL